MSRQIVDQPARDRIKNDLATNLLIEAGAGSGKTTCLVERMVNLIYTGTAEIASIVAITFTRKAADELKLRFQSELEKKWKMEPDSEAKRILANALQNMEQCFIGTVHSFCARLLRERPIEANLDLNFQELEEAEDLEVLEETWQLYLYQLQEKDLDQLTTISDLGIDFEVLFDSLKKLKSYPEVEWVTSESEKPELQATFRAFLSLVQEAKRAIPDQEPDKGYDSLQKSILTAVKKTRHLDTGKDKNLIEIFELFNKKITVTQNRWVTKEDAKHYRDTFSAFVDASISGAMQQWYEYCHPKLIYFLSGAMEVYQQIKKQRSLLNLQDLLLKTNELVRENAEVRRYFQERYKFLLVDEFQDTDPIQAEIMFFLTGEDHHQKVWTACRPKPGSLFVVGDPKQAIYRFRRADIDTYNRVKQLIEQHGGEVLQLTMNFRTIDTITGKLNPVFQELLPETETIYQAAFRPLDAFHQEKGSLEELDVLQLTVPGDYTTKDVIVEQDADNIARQITAYIKKGHRAKEFMVLTRYTEGIATYARRMEDYGIPVSVSGEIVIGETTEFRDLLTLLCTFIDPTDQLAFAATLRSVFFGISDEDLYQWKQAGGSFSIYSDIPDSLKEPVREKFTIALAKLRSYQKWIRTLPATAAIEEIIEDIGFYPLLLHNKHGKRAHKSLLQILEGIRKAEADGNTAYKTICTLFQELVMEKTTVVNIEEEADAVRVMNIHKAKGLEAPIVFLSHPCKLVKPDSFLSQHIKREDQQSQGFFCFSVSKGYQTKTIAQPAHWEEYKQEELRYLVEEETRILYVASTRAQKALIISSSAKSNTKNPWNAILTKQSINEIELPEHITVPERTEETILLQEFQNQTKNRLDWLEESKKTSYGMWSPSDHKDYGEVLNMEREAGGGKDWGSLIHNVLEKVVQGEEVTNYIRNLLARYNLPQEREKEVLDYIDSFKKSDIWQELKQADEVLAEVPFTLKVSEGDPLYHLLQTDQQTVLVKGVIDLIYQTSGEWTIVDYKTDRVKSEADLSILQTFYSNQIHFYKQAWEQMTGATVKNSSVFFFTEQTERFVK